MKSQSLIFLFLFISIACTNSQKTREDATQGANKIAEKSKVGTTDDQATNIRNGKAVFLQYCATCHMVDGSGVRGLQPPLTDPKWISGEEQFVYILEKGISGTIDVNGKQYNNLMPAHKHLTNKEMANVITYVRKSFGNNFDAVTAKEVAKIRRSIN